MAMPEITWAAVQESAPEDGQRYEAIGGHVYVTPAPKTRHQRISYKLTIELDRLLVAPGHGILFVAPYGLEFPETGEGVQPDLFFVARGGAAVIGEDWTRGAPDLVIEILSPSTARRDRTVKRDLYRGRGVPVYWIVDPDDESVQVWDLAASPPSSESFRERLPVRVSGSEVGDLDLGRIFAPDP